MVITVTVISTVIAGIEQAMSELTVTVLVENAACARGLIGEHGLSYWIEHRGKRILFDTGAGTALFHNAESMGIDLAGVDVIAVSHGHYDHTGGLLRLLDMVPRRVPVYLHPAALQPKYSGSGGRSHSAGMTDDELSAIRSCGHELVFTEQVTELAEGIHLTGYVPRTTDYEDTGGPFYLDAELTRPDPLDDDQSLYIDCSGVTYVLLGCAHAGVVNTLDHIRSVTGRGIDTCIGGMHLSSADENRLSGTVAALRGMGIRRLGPMHCTGMAASARLWTELPGRCLECHAGSVIR